MLSLALSCLFCIADDAETQAIITLGSHHFGSNYEFNELNPGVGIQKGNWGLVSFKNSYSNTSIYGYYSASNKTEWGEYGITVGAATGYDRGIVTPIATGYVEYKGVNISAIPSFLDWDDEGEDSDLIVLVSYRFEI